MQKLSHALIAGQYQTHPYFIKSKFKIAIVVFQNVEPLNDTSKTGMVEYITARTTTNRARAEHLTMERGLQIADLSQRLDGSSREKTGVRSSRMAMAGSALSHPQPPIYPFLTLPPFLCSDGHQTSLRVFVASQ